MTLGLGPQVEYEILNNNSSVDLLIQLAYVAAAENALKHHPPAGAHFLLSCSIGAAQAFGSPHRYGHQRAAA